MVAPVTVDGCPARSVGPGAVFNDCKVMALSACLPLPQELGRRRWRAQSVPRQAAAPQRPPRREYAPPTRAMKAFKSAMGIEEKPKTAAEEMEEACCELCPKLTYKQRIGGYLTCFGLAFVLSIGSWVRLADLIKGNPTPFVVFYTLGNLMGIAGSLFLSGPKAQCKAMWDLSLIHISEPTTLRRIS